MKKKGVLKGQQSNVKILYPYHRRESLRRKTVCLKHLKTDNDAGHGQRRCRCGIFMSLKRKAKHCIMCERDILVLNQCPEMHLKMLRVRLVNLAASCSSSDGTNLRRADINLNLKGKQLSKTCKNVRSPKYPQPKKASKSPRLRNPKLKKSIKTHCKSVSKKSPVNETTEKASPRAVGVRSRKRGRSALGREGTKGVAKKKRSTKSATRKITPSPKKTIVRRIRQANCSRETSHKCRKCGVTCESNVEKLLHEINHQKKILFVVLDQCDVSTFIPFHSHNGERSEGDRSIALDSSGTRAESDASANDASTEVASSSSQIQQCSELEKLNTGLDIHSDNVSAKNDFIGPSNALKTEVKLNGTEPTRSPVESSLVETVDHRVVNSSNEFIRRVDVSSPGGDMDCAQLPLNLSSETWDMSSHRSTLEVDQFYTSENAISSSVNASHADHSDSELLIDEESQEDSLDMKSDSSNLENQNFYCDRMNDSKCTENTPILEEEEVAGEGYEGVRINEPLLGVDRNETNELSPVEVSVSDAVLQVEDADATPSVGMQKAIGTEQYVQEEAYESESDSASATFADENNLLNEELTDFTGNRNYSPALEHSEVSGHESETVSNISEVRVLNQVERDSVKEKQFKYVSITKEDPTSADVDLYEGSGKTGILGASVSWSHTSCSLDIVHTDISHQSTSESPSNSTYGEPPGLSDLTSHVPEVDSEQEDISVINSISVME